MTTTKTRKTSAKGTDLREGLVDKALKKRYDELMARYHAALADESSGWDARFEALDEIINSDPPYYLAASYATAKQFLKAEVPQESERNIRTKILVARHFDPEDESRYGITRLEALIGILRAEAGGELGRVKIHPERQKVRVKEGKTTKLVPFAEATRDQLKAAIRLAQGKTGTSRAALPPLVAALKKALAGAKLADVGVSIRGGKVTLSGIDAVQFAALAKVLKGVKG